MHDVERVVHSKQQSPPTAYVLQQQHFAAGRALADLRHLLANGLRLKVVPHGLRCSAQLRVQEHRSVNGVLQFCLFGSTTSYGGASLPNVPFLVKATDSYSGCDSALPKMTYLTKIDATRVYIIRPSSVVAQSFTTSTLVQLNQLTDFAYMDINI